MFTFDTTDVQRLALSAIGAVVLTATCVGAAVAPARAATPVVASADAWQAAVERQIDSRSDDFSLRMDSGQRREAVVAVRFTADGDYAGADIARSSGNAALDRHALKVASKLDYPLLPQTMRGKPQTVAMRLFFGRADTSAQYVAMNSSTKGVKLAAAGGAGSNVIAAK